MLTYVYLVKCPNCEDEFFDFFDEAKDYALGCLNQKPIITQTEVNRNDFGECIDHCDLGTVWSWEDMMKDTDRKADDSCSHVLCKADLEDIDSEFDNIDNSVDVEINEISDSRKPIPEGMTIEELVEAMEENEDTVECTKCGGLFEKAACHHNKEGFGWSCSNCDPVENLTEAAFNSLDEITLHYEDIGEDGYDYVTYKDEVLDALADMVTDEELQRLSKGRFNTFDEINDYDDEHYWKDETAYTHKWTAFLENNFDELLKAHEKEVLDYLRDEATAAFEEAEREYKAQNAWLDDADYRYHSYIDSLLD